MRDIGLIDLIPEGVPCGRCGAVPALSCFDDDEDGEPQDSTVTAFLCEECAKSSGYCVFCGHRDETVRNNENGYCEYCVSAIEEDDNYPEPTKEGYDDPA